MAGTFPFKGASDDGDRKQPVATEFAGGSPIPQLHYMADMLGQMEGMAKNVGAETLADLLQVARNEAMRFARGR